MRQGRLRQSAAALLGIFSVLWFGAVGSASAQVTPGDAIPLGLNLDLNEQSLVNWGFDNLSDTDGNPLAAGKIDPNGWPASDFRIYLDNRYFLAWDPSNKNADPLKYSTNISGVYKLSFKGQGTPVNAFGGDSDANNWKVSNVVYDAASNTTAADLQLKNPAGGVVMFLNIINTKRNPGDTAGTGVTDIRMIRPGYPTNTTQIFTDKWLKTVNEEKWAALRFMGVLGTNSYGQGAEAYPYQLTWNDRALPGVGPLYGQKRAGVHGIPWEWTILIGNAANKHLWINIPVNASDDYVLQTAKLLKNGNAYTNNVGIKPGLNLYVEYSNEPWHDGFPQGPYIQAAAEAEVKAGASNLNYDNLPDTYDRKNIWRQRKIAKRTLQIGQIFRSVFTDNPDRIRPVINDANVFDPRNMLRFIADNYGEPNQYLYGISQTGYWASNDASSVDAVIAGEQINSDNNRKQYISYRALATFYGLKSLVYEGGQGDTGTYNPWGEVDTGFPNKIAAARSVNIKDSVTHDLNNWYTAGGDLYMQFAHVGHYSTFGFWGLSEDLDFTNTGKWQGVREIMNAPAPNQTVGVSLPIVVDGATDIPVTSDVFPPLPWYDAGTRPNRRFYLLYAPAKATYALTLTTGGNFPKSHVELWADNKLLASPTIVPTTDAVTFAVEPGFHALQLVDPLPYDKPVAISGPLTVTCLSVDTNGKPGGPRNLQAMAASRTIYLSWLPPQGAPVTSYNIYRSATPNIPANAAPFQQGVTGTVFKDGNLNNNKPFYYRVAAINDKGVSPMSGEVSATPKVRQETILCGVLLGSPGSKSGTSQDDFTAAWDGNIITAFEGPESGTGNGLYTGIDIGKEWVAQLTKASFYPRNGAAERMVGGKFQGSSDGKTWHTLKVIVSAPAQGQWTTLSVPTINQCRYLRYLSPNGGWGNVAEIVLKGVLSPARETGR